jgi:hypothetical protein
MCQMWRAIAGLKQRFVIALRLAVRTARLSFGSMRDEPVGLAGF